MTNIMTFSSTEANFMHGLALKPQVWTVFASVSSKAEVIGTGAITNFVISSQPHGFNFDLAKMTSRVECDEVVMPSDMNTVEELDAWLMGLNLE